MATWDKSALAESLAEAEAENERLRDRNLRLLKLLATAEAYIPLKALGEYVAETGQERAALQPEKPDA
jgi:hypothetical protein